MRRSAGKTTGSGYSVCELFRFRRIKQMMMNFREDYLKANDEIKDCNIFRTSINFVKMNSIILFAISSF